MSSKLVIEFKDKETRQEFMKWFEDNGHINYHGDMDFSSVDSEKIAEEFYFDYSKGTIITQ